MSNPHHKGRLPNQFFSRIILRSNLQAQRLSIKQIFPRVLKFDLDEPINSLSFRKISKFLPKSKPTLKNPPMKLLVRQYDLMQNTRALSIKPEDAQAYIKKISLHFSRLNRISICTQENSFAPMKIKGKVRPIRSLQIFCHNHELCQEFMTCARYVTHLKIKRSSVNLAELKRFKRLQTLNLLFKTKYVTFPDQDRKFLADLIRIIGHDLPVFNRIILKHELDPENSPYLPLQLHNALEGRVQVDLTADLVDISNLRNHNNSVERIFEEIGYSGIQRMNISYAGIMKPVKKFARWFCVPIYFRKELYLRLLRAIQASNLAYIQFEPIIHSSHISFDLKDALLSLMKPGSPVKIPKITFIYCLDTIEEEVFKLLLDMYNGSIYCYDLAIVSTTYLTHEQCEKLEHHYAQFLSKVHRYDVKFSLSITARTYKNLISLLQIFVPRVNLSRLTSLSIKIINPLTKSGLLNLAKLLTKSLSCCPIQQLEISISQEGIPGIQEIFDMVHWILQKSPKLKSLTLLHQNSEEHEEVINDAFKRLRREKFWVDLKCENNKEKGVLYEQI